MAVAFLPAAGVDVRQVAETAQLASMADETPEGRSVMVLAKNEYGLRAREIGRKEHALFLSPRRRG